MARTNVFRKVSLDRLSSPEQLDQLLQVTSTKGWISLASVGVLLLTAIVWSVFGSLPDTVAGEGILLKSGGIFQIVPAGAGRVVDVAVNVGDVVSDGQIVARVAQPDLADQVREAKSVVAHARQEYEQALHFGARDASLQGSALAQQRKSLEEAVRGAQQNLRWLEEKIGNQTQLLERGLLTKQTLLTTRQQYAELGQKLLADESQLTQLRANELQVQGRQSKDVQTTRFRLLQAEQDLAQAERAFREASEVVSPHNGRVLEVMVEQGTVVARGEPMMSLDLTGRTVKELEAIIYVPSVQGKKLKPNMPIHIAPSTVRKEEYGYMLGRVTYVSDFPATPKGMVRVLKNEKLATGLSAGDAPYEVHADLIPDPETVSHYRWSSSSGPPLTVQSGTLALAEIIVNRRRPIQLVIPLMRKYTGM